MQARNNLAHDRAAVKLKEPKEERLGKHGRNFTVKSPR